MKCIRSSVSSLAILLACAVALPATAQSSRNSHDVAGYRPVVGQPHPQLVLPNIEDRQAVSLAQFRGKKVLLIHFASW